MMKVYSSVTDLIGNTPLMRLSQLEQQEDCRATVLAKLEYFNPAGSAKDRVAYAMILEAENDGRLCPGATIIEPTSGNTGVGLAAVAAARGYHVILTMPETMSVERQALLRAYGAEVVLTDGSRGMAGAIDKANELAAAIPGSFIPGQFDNPANPAAHYASTGPEIWRDTDGKVDIFIAGVGTGGTITGVAQYLKEQNPAVQIIGVEPANSRVLAGGKPGAHGLQGIGANFVPAVLDMALLDEIIPITDDEAYTYGRALAHREGLLTGITAGAAVCAAFRVAKRPENAGKTVVALLPDTGERYLSTPLFRAENE